MSIKTRNKVKLFQIDHNYLTTRNLFQLPFTGLSHLSFIHPLKNFGKIFHSNSAFYQMNLLIKQCKSTPAIFLDNSAAVGAVASYGRVQSANPPALHHLLWIFWRNFLQCMEFIQRSPITLSISDLQIASSLKKKKKETCKFNGLCLWPLNILFSCTL